MTASQLRRRRDTGSSCFRYAPTCSMSYVLPSLLIMHIVAAGEQRQTHTRLPATVYTRKSCHQAGSCCRRQEPRRNRSTTSFWMNKYPRRRSPLPCTQPYCSWCCTTHIEAVCYVGVRCCLYYAVLRCLCFRSSLMLATTTSMKDATTSTCR